MKPADFLRRLRKPGRIRGVAVTVDVERGKGGHVVVYFGRRRTTLPMHSRELKPLLLAAICKQLGVERDEL